MGRVCQLESPLQNVFLGLPGRAMALKVSFMKYREATIFSVSYAFLLNLLLLWRKDPVTDLFGARRESSKLSVS